MILSFAIFALVVIGIGCAIRLLTRPMTCCLTFDDGLKVHAEIAAPLLEKFGWRGTFNVPTSIHLVTGMRDDIRIASVDQPPLKFSHLIQRRGFFRQFP